MAQETIAKPPPRPRVSIGNVEAAALQQLGYDVRRGVDPERFIYGVWTIDRRLHDLLSRIHHDLLSRIRRGVSLVDAVTALSSVQADALLYKEPGTYYRSQTPFTPLSEISSTTEVVINYICEDPALAALFCSIEEVQDRVAAFMDYLAGEILV